MPLPKPAEYTADDYWNLPDNQRAELVDGELYYMSRPTRVHQRLVMQLSYAFQRFINTHDGPCEVYPAPFGVNLFNDDTTFVEPDISVICDPSKLSDRGCEGAPDLVVEIASPTNWRWDYFTKAGLYERAGVREYWIVNPTTREIIVYRYAQLIFDKQESQDAQDADAQAAQATEDPGSPLLSTYSFDQPVPVGIWDDELSITLLDLLG